MRTSVAAASAIGCELVRVGPGPESSRARSIIGLQASNEGGRPGTQRRADDRKAAELAASRRRKIKICVGNLTKARLASPKSAARALQSRIGSPAKGQPHARSRPVDRCESEPPAVQFVAQALRLMFRRFPEQAVSASQLTICGDLLADALVELQDALIGQILQSGEIWKSHGEVPRLAWGLQVRLQPKVQKAGPVPCRKSALNEKGAAERTPRLLPDNCGKCGPNGRNNIDVAA